MIIRNSIPHPEKFLQIYFIETDLWAKGYCHCPWKYNFLSLFIQIWIKWDNVHSDLFFKFEFNSVAQVLALLKAIKDNNSSSANCFIMDAISYHLIGCSCVNKKKQMT